MLRRRVRRCRRRYVAPSRRRWPVRLLACRTRREAPLAYAGNWSVLPEDLRSLEAMFEPNTGSHHAGARPCPLVTAQRLPSTRLWERCPPTRSTVASVAFLPLRRETDTLVSMWSSRWTLSRCTSTPEPALAQWRPARAIGR